MASLSHETYKEWCASGAAAVLRRKRRDPTAELIVYGLSKHARLTPRKRLPPRVGSHFPRKSNQTIPISNKRKRKRKQTNQIDEDLEISTLGASVGPICPSVSVQHITFASASKHEPRLGSASESAIGGNDVCQDVHSVEHHALSFRAKKRPLFSSKKRPAADFVMLSVPKSPQQYVAIVEGVVSPTDGDLGSSQQRQHYLADIAVHGRPDRLPSYGHVTELHATPVAPGAWKVSLVHGKDSLPFASLGWEHQSDLYGTSIRLVHSDYSSLLSQQRATASTKSQTPGFVTTKIDPSSFSNKQIGYACHENAFVGALAVAFFDGFLSTTEHLEMQHSLAQTVLSALRGRYEKESGGTSLAAVESFSVTGDVTSMASVDVSGGVVLPVNIDLTQNINSKSERENYGYGVFLTTCESTNLVVAVEVAFVGSAPCNSPAKITLTKQTLHHHTLSLHARTSTSQEVHSTVESTCSSLCDTAGMDFADDDRNDNVPFVPAAVEESTLYTAPSSSQRDISGIDGNESRLRTLPMSSDAPYSATTESCQLETAQKSMQSISMIRVTPTPMIPSTSIRSPLENTTGTSFGRSLFPKSTAGLSHNMVDHDASNDGPSNDADDTSVKASWPSFHDVFFGSHDEVDHPEIAAEDFASLKDINLSPDAAEFHDALFGQQTGPDEVENDGLFARRCLISFFLLAFATPLLWEVFRRLMMAIPGSPGSENDELHAPLFRSGEGYVGTVGIL